MPRLRLIVALCLATGVSGSLASRADAFNPGTPCGPLQTLVDNAPDGGTVQVDTIYHDCHVAVTDKSLTFHGSTPNAGFSGSDGTYANIRASGSGTVVVSDLTFRNASNGSGNGGAIEFRDNVTPRVFHSRFFGNHALAGGGAVAITSIPPAPMVIRDSIFGSSAAGQGNAALQGGAVSIGSTSQPVLLQNNTFVNNSATSTGGAVYLLMTAGSPVTVTGNSFIQNRAVTGGGGAALATTGTLALTKSRFVGNKSVETASTTDRRMGGGLSVVADGGVTQSDNLFSGNLLSYSMGVVITDSGGGGEWVGPGTQLTSRRDRFVGNSTVNTNTHGPETGGGAVYVYGCGTGIANASLQDFVAGGNHVGTPGDGSGVYDGCAAQPVHLQVLDSTIAANTGGGQIDGGDADSLAVKNSIIAPAPGTAAINGFGPNLRTVEYSDTCRAAGPRPAGPGNICADPRLVNAGAGDIHETSKSPTRDRGSNGRIPAGLTTDFENAARITDAEPDGIAIVDMGADETRTGALRLTRLRSSARTVRLSGRHRRGTKFAVTINGPARVTYTFTRLLGHRRTRGAGGIARNVRRAGRPTLAFKGRVGRRTLAPGTYRLTVTAKNRLNNRSNRVTTTFRVSRR